jgi:hypothetical protein
MMAERGLLQKGPRLHKLCARALASVVEEDWTVRDDFLTIGDRLGMVYEARGDNQNAPDCYRKVIPFVCARLDDYVEVFAQARGKA